MAVRKIYLRDIVESIPPKLTIVFLISYVISRSSTDMAENNFSFKKKSSMSRKSLLYEAKIAVRSRAILSVRCVTPSISYSVNQFVRQSVNRLVRQSVSLSASQSVRQSVRSHLSSKLSITFLYTFPKFIHSKRRLVKVGYFPALPSPR